MTSSKIKRLLTEALNKYGYLDVLQLIYYYYQETYEGIKEVVEDVDAYNVYNVNEY